MHIGSLPTKASPLRDCAFASTNYFLSCEDDSLDAHNDSKNNTENTVQRLICTGEGEHLPLGDCCHCALEKKGGGWAVEMTG